LQVQEIWNRQPVIFSAYSITVEMTVTILRRSLGIEIKTVAYSVFWKVFWGTETASQIFPTVSQNTVEPLYNHHQDTVKPRFMTILVLRSKSCVLSKIF